MDRRIDLTGALAAMGIGFAVIVLALRYPEPNFSYDPIGPMGFPAFLGGALVVLGGIQAYKTTRTLQADGIVGEPEGTPDEPEHPSSAGRAMGFAGGSFLYVAALLVLGYLLATPLFVGLGLWALGFRHLGKLAFLAIAFTAISFYIFSTVLSVPLPLGFTQAWLAEIGLVGRVR